MMYRGQSIQIPPGSDPKEIEKMVKSEESITRALMGRFGGEAAQATIVSVEDTGVRIGANPFNKFRLEVKPKDKSPFTAETAGFIKFESQAKYQAGSKVWVQFDPKDHTRVTLVDSTMWDKLSKNPSAFASLPHPHPGRVGVVISSLGIAFCLTCIFLSARRVMDVGGFVASGGPYVIAHQAPPWMMPMDLFTIFGGIIFVVINFVSVGRSGGLNPFLAWPALFLSLAWNFFEYGLFKFHRILWSWLFCFILFILLGGIPLLGILPELVKKPDKPNSRAPVLLIAVQIAAIGLAVCCGILLFRRLS